MSAYVGQPGASARAVQACHSSAPNFAAHPSAAGSSDDQYVVASPALAPGLSQRGIHSGACEGSCLCQKPRVPAPLGYRFMFSGRPSRYGRMTGAMRAA